MAVLPVAYGPIPNAGGTGTLPTYLSRASTLSGLSATDLAYFWDDFTTEPTTNTTFGWLVGGGGSASTTTQIAATGGGLLMLNTGASAASNAQWTQVDGIISNVSTAKWYAACRFRVTTTPDAQTTALVGLINQAASKTIACGVVGSLDATHFVLQYDGNATGSVLSLVTAINTSFHVYEMWGTGSTTLNVAIDGGAPLSVTMAAAPADYASAIMTVRNGTTAASQQIQTDWVLVAGARS